MARNSLSPMEVGQVYLHPRLQEAHYLLPALALVTRGWRRVQKIGAEFNVAAIVESPFAP